jgi:uncharacterized protein YndB with AHSA1/START domain
MTRWIQMRPVGLEFLDEAPLRVAVEVESSLPRARVWAAFVDPTTWPDWFPGVQAAAYPDQFPPYGVGTARTAEVSGELFEETLLAWDEPKRWSYRIDRCTAPLASAQVESTEFSDRPGGGTRVRWILASDPSDALARAEAALPGILESRLAEALANLEELARSEP